ncbi:MAG TPA: DUF2007 domain-containing protein [Thermoanaerobaculia bacterium]|nr:DUF2007 domain-containing protein [Thermoanaerobaculia bacterium]
MICPECGSEYENDVPDCEGCEVPLVEEVDDGVEEVDFAPLVESTDVAYFGLVTARLEEAGIPWFVQGETSLGVLPRDGGEMGDPGEEVVTVHVAENRFREARQLVRDLDPVEADDWGG